MKKKGKNEKGQIFFGRRLASERISFGRTFLPKTLRVIVDAEKKGNSYGRSSRNLSEENFFGSNFSQGKTQETSETNRGQFFGNNTLRKSFPSEGNSCTEQRIDRKSGRARKIPEAERPIYSRHAEGETTRNWEGSFGRKLRKLVSLYTLHFVTASNKTKSGGQLWYPRDRGDDVMSENAPAATTIKVLRKASSEVSFGRHPPNISTVTYRHVLQWWLSERSSEDSFGRLSTEAQVSFQLSNARHTNPIKTQLQLAKRGQGETLGISMTYFLQIPNTSFLP